MVGTLTLLSASPAQYIEPLSFDEVRSYLGLPEATDYSDYAQNEELGSYITAAREQAEIAQGRDLVQKQYELRLDYWPGPEIRLRAPLVSVDAFTYRDSNGTVHTMALNTDYIVDTAKHPGIVLPPYNCTWPCFTPWPSSAIMLRFTSGFASNAAFWSDAGARVKVGMRLLISGWFNNKLPFEIGASAIQEYPYSVTACLSHGALPRCV